jgi:predicted nucleotidyltransferase
MLDSILRTTLASVLEKYRKEVVFAYLFGSMAQENAFPLSDVDIAVFLRDAEERTFFDTKLALLGDLCRILKRNDVDVLVLNTAKNLILIEQVIRNGIIIFDQDPELREKFEQEFLHQVIDFKRQRFIHTGV